MTSIKDLPIGSKVTARLGGVGYRGVIVDMPEDRAPAENMVAVKFTPPVEDTQRTDRREYYTLLVAWADRGSVTPGWPEDD